MVAGGEELSAGTRLSFPTAADDPGPARGTWGRAFAVCAEKATVIHRLRSKVKSRLLESYLCRSNLAVFEEDIMDSKSISTLTIFKKFYYFIVSLLQFYSSDFHNLLPLITYL